MQRPLAIEFNLDNQAIVIDAFDAQEASQSLLQQAVQIIASGPSITATIFNEQQLQRATIFVNGSISLLAEHEFTQVVGWVISDARFISHQPDIFEQYYTGQPLYATFSVFEAMAAHHPDVILKYHQVMRALYSTQHLSDIQTNKPQKPWHSTVNIVQKWRNKKHPLAHLATHPRFVIDALQKPKPIGVSLDITYGFVEAGTVAYVAAQLAFSRHAGAIHLYGVDLINSHQPRFYEHKGDSAPCKLDKAITNRIVPSFNLLARVYKAQGVSVINHSPVSKSLFEDFD